MKVNNHYSSYRFRLKKKRNVKRQARSVIFSFLIRMLNIIFTWDRFQFSFNFVKTLTILKSSFYCGMHQKEVTKMYGSFDWSTKQYWIRKQLIKTIYLTCTYLYRKIQRRSSQLNHVNPLPSPITQWQI